MPYAELLGENIAFFEPEISMERARGNVPGSRSGTENLAYNFQRFHQAKLTATW